MRQGDTLVSFTHGGETTDYPVPREEGRIQIELHTGPDFFIRRDGSIRTIDNWSEPGDVIHMSCHVDVKASGRTILELAEIEINWNHYRAVSPQNRTRSWEHWFESERTVPLLGAQGIEVPADIPESQPLGRYQFRIRFWVAGEWHYSQFEEVDVPKLPPTKFVDDPRLKELREYVLAIKEILLGHNKTDEEIAMAKSHLLNIKHSSYLVWNVDEIRRLRNDHENVCGRYLHGDHDTSKDYLDARKEIADISKLLDEKLEAAGG